MLGRGFELFLGKIGDNNDVLINGDWTMTPEQQQAIQTNVEAIAAILYADCDPESLKTLEELELTVKDKVLTHVTPQIGIFLSPQLAAQKQEG